MTTRTWTESHCVRRVSAVGVVVTIAGSGRVLHEDGIGAAASFRHSCGIAVDEVAGVLYVTDNHRVRSVRLANSHVSTVAWSRSKRLP